jgi:hypothetical protein
MRKPCPDSVSAESKSGPEEGLNPLDQYYLTSAAGMCGGYYLYYFGKATPDTGLFLNYPVMN